MKIKIQSSLLAAAVLVIGAGVGFSRPAAAPVAPAAKNTAAPSVLEAWQKADYRFTPEVESAFLDAAKSAALQKLAAEGRSLPADFLAWVDSDPIVKTTVYGARQDPAGILCLLRSLEIDLGQEVVRQQYTQLALAMAVVHAEAGEQADLSPRPLLVLRIGGDPRVRVDTHDTTRPLDLDDHIINFLNDHAPIVEDVVVGYKEVPPDASGQPAGKKRAKPKKEPIMGKRSRPLRAADVIASASLEKEFNEYLKAHGETAQIHCGDGKRLNWKSTDLKGIDTAGTKAAYALFEHAYQAKGYLPAEHDPAPTPAEACAYLIRNDEFTMPDGKKVAWPKFPLTAPWPVLTFLAADPQPLREREDIWERYRDKGEFHGYGEYVGPIAQSPLYLQARRLEPYAFSYGSVQMMLKDGGVCGTMANIAVRSFKSLGVPASTAGQPGHCALVRFDYDTKAKTYRCVGGQYVTAGDAGTGVHVPWLFGDVNSRRPMVYHQSIAWSVNYGFQAYLDSTVAHTFFKQLSDAGRQAHGSELLSSAAALCPYNFLLVDDAIATAGRPAALVAFWNELKPLLASGKPGCPADGLYNTTIKGGIFNWLAIHPVPGDRAQAGEILAFLQAENCENPSALAAYQVAVNGLPALLAETDAAFKNHLAAPRNDAGCAKMAGELAATAQKITDKHQRIQWSLDRWQEIQGKELYPGRRNAITPDKSLGTLAKLAGKKARPEPEQIQSLLDRIAGQLQTETAGARNPQDCKRLAGVIAAIASQLKDAGQKQRWLETLAAVIDGKENYQLPGAKTNAKPLRDPCADTISKLLALQTGLQQAQRNGSAPSGMMAGVSPMGGTS